MYKFLVFSCLKSKLQSQKFLFLDKYTHIVLIIQCKRYKRSEVSHSLLKPLNLMLYVALKIGQKQGIKIGHKIGIKKHVIKQV